MDSGFFNFLREIIANKNPLKPATSQIDVTPTKIVINPNACPTITMNIISIIINNTNPINPKPVPITDKNFPSLKWFTIISNVPIITAMPPVPAIIPKKIKVKNKVVSRNSFLI